MAVLDLMSGDLVWILVELYYDTFDTLFGIGPYVGESF